MDLSADDVESRFRAISRWNGTDRSSDRYSVRAIVETTVVLYVHTAINMSSVPERHLTYSM
jgi:hypothetical protein